jgi:hypothetical protein
MGKVPDFIRSVPVDKTMHPDTLPACDMNGAPLPSSHGFPLRRVASGWAGDFLRDKGVPAPLRRKAGRPAPGFGSRPECC